MLDGLEGEGQASGCSYRTFLGRIIEQPVTPVLAHELGELLARLHTHRLPWYGEAGTSQSDRAGLVDVMCKRSQDRLRSCEGVVDAGLSQDIRAAHSLLSDGLPHADGLCCLCRLPACERPD